MTDAIGGFFPLEISTGQGHYHQDAIKLNTARNCLEYILRVRKYKKIYLPIYYCDVLLEAVQKLAIEYELYQIDEHLNPVFDKNLSQSEALLYINYFGLKQDMAKNLANKFSTNLILDNAQAFFEPWTKNIDTFYSPRKYFGVPDGGYLYIDTKLDEQFDQDQSFDRMTHLLKRIDVSAEAAYDDFKLNEEALAGQPIKKMSKITDALLSSINYENVQKIRRQNYGFLDGKLSGDNQLSLNLEEQTPMVYPFRTKTAGIRQKLIDNKIYAATYWPNVISSTAPGTLEHDLAQQIIPLPIDQRYNETDLNEIVRIING